MNNDAMQQVIDLYNRYGERLSDALTRLDEAKTQSEAQKADRDSSFCLGAQGAIVELLDALGYDLILDPDWAVGIVKKEEE